MSASSFHHVLALLDEDAEAMWAVLDRAVELADAENARLTLAKTTAPGRVVTCLSPMAALLCMVPLTSEELEADAGRRLALATEFVPASIPLTTVLLGTDTAASLRRLVERGGHDLLVVRRGLLPRCGKLRRVIRRLGIATLTVSREPASRSRLLSRASFHPRPAPQA